MATKKLTPKAKVKVPAKTKKDSPIVKTIMVEKKVIDWKKVKTGMYFTAKIHGTKVFGAIYRGSGNYIYLCQNSKDGSSIPNKLGYKYSWVLLRDEYNIKGFSSHVKDLDFPTPPKGYAAPLIMPEMAGYLPVINIGYVQFGCKKVANKNIRFLAKHLKD